MERIAEFWRSECLRRFLTVMVAAALILGVASCDNGAEPSRYNLTVVADPPAGGTALDLTGTSPYAVGTSVSIRALAEEGYVFVGWTAPAGTFDDPDVNETTFTMPTQHVTVTANFVEEGSEGLFAGGSGTAVDPYRIADWHHLSNVRYHLSSHFLLISPLDSATPGYAGLAGASANQGRGWKPIGTDGYPFTGVLDGQGYEIGGLRINRPTERFVGLFGYVRVGVVENVRLVNAAVTGRDFVGALTGLSYQGLVSDSYSDAVVAGSHSVGGLLGWNYGGQIVNSSSRGSVEGPDIAGGLVGRNWGTVFNSYYDYDDVLINGDSIITIGALMSEDFSEWLNNEKFLDVNYRLTEEDGYYLIQDVGDFRELLAFGQDDSLRFRLVNDLDLAAEPDFYIPYLAGEFDGQGCRVLNLSFSHSPVGQVGVFGCLGPGGRVSNLGVENVSIAGSWHVGGLVGLVHEGELSNCYATGSVTARTQVGGLVGFMHHGIVTNSHSVTTVTGEHSAGGLVGSNWYGTVSNSHYDYDEVLINGENVITIGALPGADFDEWLGNGRLLDVSERLSEEDGYYLVHDVDDFIQLLAFGQGGSLRFRLTANLDLTEQPGLYIPYLAGKFDGDGHRISHLSVRSDFVAQAGLFGFLAPGSEVTQVGVDDADIIGCEAAGGLAGYSGGTVSLSYSGGTVAAGSSQARVGGLVGWSDGIVSNCYAGASATGHEAVGGLVGMVGGAVEYSYSTGSVDGSGWVGGLIGRNFSATADNSFWDTETSGQVVSGGGTGKTTTQMRDIGTFTDAGWDIVSVDSGESNPAYTWNIVAGETYPFLSITAAFEFEATPMVAAGRHHTVGLRSDGTALAVGNNDYGQRDVGGWTGIVQVAAGGYHTVGLKSDGTAVAVGRNDFGQCDVEDWTDIVQVAAGRRHTVGLKSDGTVIAIGNNGSGQCNVSTWTGIVQVATSLFHTVGLRGDGTVVAVGSNSDGQCNVGGWTGIVKAAAGEMHTVGLQYDGTVVAVGDNLLKQCNVGSWTHIIDIEAGCYHTVGLRADGTPVAVGGNGYGQCNVEGWTSVAQVAAGWHHTVGLRSDGTMVAVGDNGGGQCNVGDWMLN